MRECMLEMNLRTSVRPQILQTPTLGAPGGIGGGIIPPIMGGGIPIGGAAQNKPKG